tara:strand:+ start:576 stop:1193 length:618 start_codon:yes stop_codon:yes gene_type:complete
MSEIKIPQITLPTIDLPDTPYFIKHKLEGKIPGCNLYHRDLETTRNPSLLIADPNGTYTVCPEGQLPSYDPIRYDPNEIIYTEDTPRSTPATPTQTQQKTVKPKKDKKIEFEPCPGKSNQRVGDFRNEKRLERVIGHKRGDDGIECITLYEDVPFKDQYIPEVSSIVSTAVIGLVAASSPLLLNIIKPLVKNIVKKLTKNKKDVE